MTPVKDSSQQNAYFGNEPHSEEGETLKPSLILRELGSSQRPALGKLHCPPSVTPMVDLRARSHLIPQPSLS